MTSKTVPHPLSGSALRAADASLRHVAIDDTRLEAIVYIEERAVFTIDKPLTITHTLMNRTRRTPEDNAWVPVIPGTDTRFRPPTRVRIYDLESMTYTEEALEKNMPLPPQRTFTGNKTEIDAFIRRAYGTFNRYAEPQPQREKPPI